MKFKGIEVFPPLDVFDSIARFKRDYGHCQCAILDPWYNKGIGGVRDDYHDYIGAIFIELAQIADHIYLWGFPEIVAGFMGRIPRGHRFTAWLTWYYKNNPSVIRGWRSAQNACIHTSSATAVLYPEHFLNDAQLAKKAQSKLRYLPGPASVIEAPLNIGFVGRGEQTGHPAQKPMIVYEKLIRMATKKDDLVFDPMCGSGTTATVCRVLGRTAVVSDIDADYVRLTRKRLSSRAQDILLRKALQRTAGPA